LSELHEPFKTKTSNIASNDKQTTESYGKTLTERKQSRSFKLPRRKQRTPTMFSPG
jgi:hypothetical protein